MAIKTKCTICGQGFSVQDDLHGQSIKCPGCGKKTKVYTLPEIEQRAKQAELRRQEIQRKAEMHRRKKEAEERNRRAYHERSIQCGSCQRMYSMEDVDNGKATMQNGVVYCWDCAPDIPCPYCSEPIRPNAAKCKHCLEILDRQMRKAEEKKEKRASQRMKAAQVEMHQTTRSSSVLIAICIIIAAVIVVGGFIGYFEYKEYRAKKKWEKAYSQALEIIDKYQESMKAVIDSLEQYNTCPKCSGLGYFIKDYDNPPYQCRTCRGLGLVRK
ncbi:MAG: hypothetical protein ACYS8W_10220 [Planctomycetota bacterium]|jgi:DNA-directed RNA polymerase subunit RPC12/RpoP